MLGDLELVDILVARELDERLGATAPPVDHLPRSGFGRSRPASWAQPAAVLEDDIGTKNS